MKKYKYYLSLILLFVLGACSNDEAVNNSPDGASPQISVNAEFVKLLSDSTSMAGELEIRANAADVEIHWDVLPSFNLDTTVTSLKLTNGVGKLPVKWARKQENGTFTPSDLSFKGGVSIKAGEDMKYIPLILAHEVDTLKLKKSMAMTTRASATPRAQEVRFTPTTINMNETVGGSTKVELIGVDFVAFDYSDFSNAVTNIDMADLQEYIIDPVETMLFKWKPAGPPEKSFSVKVWAEWGDGIRQFFEVTYSKMIAPTLSVSKKNITLASSGGNDLDASVVTTNQSIWIATINDKPWLRISPEVGKIGDTSMSFSADANPYTAARTATVTVASGGLTETIEVVQSALVPFITVNPASHSIKAAGGTNVVSSVVTSNVDWTASGAPSWLTLSTTSGTASAGSTTISFSAQANTTAQARTASITISGINGAESKTIIITQAGAATLNITPASHQIAAAGGNNVASSSITSNVSWTASSNASWLRVSPASGSNNGTISFSADANTASISRLAIVTVTGGGISQSIAISQNASDRLDVSPKSLSIDYIGGVVSTRVTTGLYWDLSCNQSWVHPSMFGGPYSQPVDFRVDANPGPPRTAIVTIVNSAGARETVTITQGADSGIMYSSVPNMGTISKSGQSITINYQNFTGIFPAKISVMTNDSNPVRDLIAPISINSTSGTMTIHIPANTSGKQRGILVYLHLWKGGIWDARGTRFRTFIQ